MRKLVIHPAFEAYAQYVATIPERFARGEGELMHRGRNELRVMQWEGQSFVVKSFRRPSLVNRIAYGFIRPSKAERSYRYADALLRVGVGTPQPVGYITLRKGLLFGSSYYVSLKSECQYVYEDLFRLNIGNAEDVLRAVGRTTAVLHEHGFAHKDYGRENILFGRTAQGALRLEIVDLNRMFVGKVGLKAGCKNFERLPATPEMHRWMSEEYARTRGFDAEKCYRLMRAYRRTQPGKIDGLY
ncbi:MAG: lipopolysaccharide kinase InaA family protein [Prevotellaceae bacterium]|nr:lipopolysaccharide kinase InaA family protein [Prevotellaceae bacterium]